MATVTMYSPTGNPEVINVNDVEKILENGYITEEEGRTQAAAKAAQERQAWLDSPETVEERFQLLRMACERKLSATDFLMVADYPISNESKQALIQYREAIRQLNHQSGAPWDGGEELTPWPEMPVVTKINSGI